MKKTQVKTLRLATRILTKNNFSDLVKSAVETSTRSAKSAINSVIVLGLLFGSALSFVTAPAAHAAACATPASDLGTLTLPPINAPAAATYTIWSRLMVPDSTNNSINLEVDGTNCFNIGGGNITANSWQWVKHTDGDTTKLATMALTAGNHTLKYIGTKAGVSLDAVILTSDPSCTPTGVLSNLDTDCPSGDSTPPTVTVTTPANNASVSGSVPISATASDASGIRDVQFLVDGAVLNTDNSAPYSYSWDASSASNGNHIITVIATDNANLSTTSSPVTVTVTGGGGFKKGDVNHDGTVNISDLSTLLRNWGSTAPNPASADVNGDTKVDIKDLSMLLANWG